MTGDIIISSNGKYVAIDKVYWDSIKHTIVTFNARLVGIVHKNENSDLVYVRCRQYSMSDAMISGVDHWEEQTHLTCDEGDRVKSFL